jgi:ubiquitin-protein ligase
MTVDEILKEIEVLRKDKNYDCKKSQHTDAKLTTWSYWSFTHYETGHHYKTYRLPLCWMKK